MNRREFIGGAASAAMLGVAGCKGVSGGSRPEPKMAWSELIHLGMNEWMETPFSVKWPNVESPEIAAAIESEYIMADHVRFDEDVWARVRRTFVESNVNQVVIDLGEAVAYPSHPELAVKGAWSPDKLRGELRRLRSLGLEPIPKLNFSTTHDIWLGDYQRMVSTPKYYEVVSDLIADVCEIFETPRYFHLGLDEETAHFQENGQRLIVLRQGDLWWHDLLFYANECEKRGMRAWVWSDYLRRHERAEFAARMPKSVVQSPWWYLGNFDPVKNAPTRALVGLAELGYDVIPCSSNCYSHPDALLALCDWCRDRFDPSHVLGFQMAPWLEMKAIFEPRWRAGADQVRRARAKWEGVRA